MRGPWKPLESGVQTAVLCERDSYYFTPTPRWVQIVFSTRVVAMLAGGKLGLRLCVAGVRPHETLYPKGETVKPGKRGFRVFDSGGWVVLASEAKVKHESTLTNRDRQTA